MKIYKIYSEWELGISEYYSTKELALKALKNYDWNALGDYQLKYIMDNGYVLIEEINVIDE